MKRSKALVASRRDEITAILEVRGQVSVAELAEHFDVSALTIRRDLDYLESQQVLTRQYGTATLLNAQGLLEFITAQDATVITNNGKALMLEERQNVSVLLTGGELRPPRASMTGEIAMETIKRVTAAKSFLGCTGLSANFGLTSATSPEPAINSVMLEHSKQHVILADSSKIGLTSSFQFGSIDEIDLLITDTGISDDQVQLLKAYGIKEIVRVEPVLSPIDYDPITALR